MQNSDTGQQACLLLEQKLNLFNQYLTTTEQMEAAIEKQGQNNLEHLLSKRQDLICKIEILDAAIERILPTSPDKYNLIPNTFRELMRDRVSRLKQTMQRVEPLDKALIARVQQEGKSTQTDLLRKQKVRQAMKGYGSFRRYPAKFLDTHR